MKNKASFAIAMLVSLFILYVVAHWFLGWI